MYITRSISKIFEISFFKFSLLCRRFDQEGSIFLNRNLYINSSEVQICAWLSPTIDSFWFIGIWVNHIGHDLQKNWAPTFDTMAGVISVFIIGLLCCEVINRYSWNCIEFLSIYSVCHSITILIASTFESFEYTTFKHG